jgi:signal peptidase I
MGSDEARIAAPARALARARVPSIVVAVAVAVALLIARAFVAEPFAIPSESMAPTLRPGDQVLVEKLTYRFSGPRRGDLSAFTDSAGDVTLKRIVGLPGDRVAMRDGVLTVNDRASREPYVDAGRVDSVYFGPVTVPPGTVFVLGDNRGNSRDSREYGPVPRSALIGRVAVRLWPVAR